MLCSDSFCLRSVDLRGTFKLKICTSIYNFVPIRTSAAQLVQHLPLFMQLPSLRGKRLARPWTVPALYFDADLQMVSYSDCSSTETKTDACGRGNCISDKLGFIIVRLLWDQPKTHRPHAHKKS